MARARNLLEETLQAWSYTREGVVSELENIPAEQFGFKPSPKSRTIEELAQHILEVALMAAGELNRADGNFQRQSYPEFLEEYGKGRADVRGKQALIDTLRSTLAESVADFRARGEEGLLQDIVQFNGEPATRLTWLNHAIGHEEYHRGQIALCARMMGRVPALTQLIEGSS